MRLRRHAEVAGAAVPRSPRGRRASIGGALPARLDRDASQDEDVTAARLPEALTDAVAYRLRVAQEASFATYLARVGDPDLSPGRYSVLMVLDANPGITPTALSRALGRDKSTMTATLRDLETRGLAARVSRPQDKRSYGVVLSEAGTGRLAHIRQHAAAHDQTMDRILGPDKAHLMALLERIARALADSDAVPIGAGRQDGGA